MGFNTSPSESQLFLTAGMAEGAGSSDDPVLVDLAAKGNAWQALIDEEKYDHLSKAGFFKLSGAEKEDGKLHLIFDCLKCLPFKKKYRCHVSSLGNLKTHMKRCHPSQTPAYLAALKKMNTDESAMVQLKITQVDKLKTASTSAAPKVTQKHVDDLIVNYVIKDCQPFACVDGEGLKELVTGLQPGKNVMCRKTITLRVKDKYNEMKKHLIKVRICLS